jgi:hypothetical protein
MYAGAQNISPSISSDDIRFASLSNATECMTNFIVSAKSYFLILNTIFFSFHRKKLDGSSTIIIL